MKNKLLKTLTIAGLLLTIGLSAASCGTGNSSESGPVSSATGTSQGTSDAKKDFTVTFHYGIAEGATVGEDGKPSAYAETLVKESEGGKKVTLTSREKKNFDVEGYTWAYSTNDFSKTITADLDVYILYSKAKEVTVEFKNADGTVIKSITKAEGEGVLDNEYPDVSNPVYIFSSESYNSWDASKKALYEAYEGKQGYYVATADKERIANNLVLESGTYFGGWTNQDKINELKDNVNVEVVAPKAHGHAKTSSIVIDGTKDETYVEVGELVDRVVSNGKGVDTSNFVCTDVDAKLYAAYDGDYIYFFVEVKDNKVVSYGKEYAEEVANPWIHDDIDIWYSIGGTFHKINLDAFGYDLSIPTENHTTYTDWIIQNRMWATKLVGDDNLEAYKTSGAQVETTATGYTVELAIPAYADGTEDVAATSQLGGEKWGRKAVSGEAIDVALQVNSVDKLPADTNSIPTAIEHKTCTVVNNSDVFSKSEIGCMAYGVQMGKATAVGASTFKVVIE